MATSDFYIKLIVGTAIIGLLAILIWKKTHSVAFLFGILCLYYWSLFGAWSIISAHREGDIGMSYLYLYHKLFRVDLDGFYATSLVLYSLFIVVVEVIVLWMTNSKVGLNRIPPPVRISHQTLLIVSGLCAFGSYLILSDQVSQATALNLPGYLVNSGGIGELSPYFTIFEVLLKAALLPLGIGLGILASGSHSRFLIAESTLMTKIEYAALVICVLFFCFAIGRRHEPLQAVIVGMLFYLTNSRRPKRLSVGVGSFVALIALELIEFTRQFSISEVADNISYETIQDALQGAFHSNESFAAHFSLYGCLKFHIPFTYGSSLLSFVASFIPRAFGFSRPPEIYQVYAEGVGATAGQGYTIHHAAGWYLNFGVPGIVLGAIILGLVWARCFNYVGRSSSSRSCLVRISGSVAFVLFTSAIPTLARTGPEGYKGVLTESLMIPIAILTLASLSFKRSNEVGYRPILSKRPINSR